jgi:hypothetical protein
MTTDERMEEIQSRVRREKEIEDQSKVKYNTFLTQQNIEKNKEMRKDYQRMVKNKEM